MSLKMSFENLDIQLLSQKLRRLESAFRERPENITDERLDNYNLIRKRIKEINKI